MRNADESRTQPKLDEARRRWGTAEVLSGKPVPTNHNPAPTAPAAAVAIRSAA